MANNDDDLPYAVVGKHGSGWGRFATWKEAADHAKGIGSGSFEVFKRVPGHDPALRALETIVE